MHKTLGRFAIEKELGTGGMGTVYLAHAPGGRHVALKQLHPHLLASPSFLKRFLREAEIGKRVNHPNVVRTLDVHLAEEGDDDPHYLVMEYVEGQTLRALLDELGQVPEELCRHVGKEIARALAAIHAGGVVHRDLKPENVLITSDHVVKVMDLGVARLVDEAIRLSQTGAFAGSVLYAAPEQFRASDPDPRSDLYSLGLVLYELATGKNPSAGEDFAGTMLKRLNEEPLPPSTINPRLSTFFDEVTLCLLAQKPSERFSSAAELADTLEAGEDSSWWKARARALPGSRRRPMRRMPVSRETGLHGRDEELARMDALFDRVTRREGQVLLVEGEAGIGKTRLVDEFVEREHRSGKEIQFLFGSYPPGGGAAGATALAAAFCGHFGREGLEQTLRHYLRQTPMLIPAFAAMLRGEPAPEGHEPLDRDSIQTGFVHAVRALAKERPTLLFIDDLQFAPEEGRALFAALAQVAGEHRLMLVGAARPGLPEDWLANLDRLVHAARIRLGRLGPKGLARVLIDAFGSERLAQELGLQIAQKSDGNPYFVFEIIRGLREGEFIRKEADGTWVRTQVIEQIQIPSSVLDLIQARIAELEDEEKDLMDVASCVGFEFDPLLVASALGMEQIPAMKRFARIERKHRLIRSSGRTCVFDHHQIREALYDSMPQLLREPYHAALGEALESRERADGRPPGEVGGPLCVALCNHFFLGARPERAKRYLAAALDHLEGAYRNDAAVALADLALGCDDLLGPEERILVLLRKAGRLELLGRREEERAVLDEALQAADATAVPALQARVRLQLGSHLIHTADYHGAQEWLEQGRELARTSGDLRLEAEAEGSLGNIWRHLGIYTRAHEHHERTLELAREIGDSGQVAQATLDLSTVFAELGQTERARQHIDKVLEITRAAGNRRAEALARGNLGLLDLQAGAFQKARRHLDKCLMLSHEIGARRAVTEALGNLAVVFRAQGRLQDADQHFDRYLALSREVGSRLGETRALQGLGALHLMFGDLEQAKRSLDQALAESRSIGVRRVEGFAICGLGRLAELQGKPQAAARAYEEALFALREIGNRRDEASALLDLGRVRAAMGEDAGAREIFSEVATIADNLDYPTGKILAAVHRARLQTLAPAEAERILEQQGERCEKMARMRARFLLWHVTGTRSHLERAYALLGELRRFSPEPFKTSMLSKVAWHKAIVLAGKEQGL